MWTLLCLGGKSLPCISFGNHEALNSRTRTSFGDSFNANLHAFLYDSSFTQPALRGQPSSYAHTLGSDSKQNLRDDEVLVFLNEDCFKTGSWKQSEITSSQNRLQEQHELVLCFEKSVSKTRKFKVGPNPEHYLARLSNGPVVVEASIIEHQGGGLPSRNSKMPLPRRVLQNSPFCH